jgi:hypothetical protein
MKTKPSLFVNIIIKQFSLTFREDMFSKGGHENSLKREMKNWLSNYIRLLSLKSYNYYYQKCLHLLSLVS